MDLTNRYLPQAEFLLARGYFSGMDKYELARKLEEIKKRHKPQQFKAHDVTSSTVN